MVEHQQLLQRIAEAEQKVTPEQETEAQADRYLALLDDCEGTFEKAPKRRQKALIASAVEKNHLEV